MNEKYTQPWGELATEDAAKLVELNLELVNLQSLPDEIKANYAAQISEITHVDEYKMVKLSPEEVANKEMILLIGEDGQPKSFVGHDEVSIYPDGEKGAEVGTAFTDVEYRKMGLNTIISAQMWDSLSENLVYPYVFTNLNSIGPYSDMKNVKMAEYEHELPPAAIDLCKNCDHYPIAKDEAARKDSYQMELDIVEAKQQIASSPALKKILGQKSTHLQKLIAGETEGRVQCCDTPLVYAKDGVN